MSNDMAARIDAYWASRLGCDAGQLYARGCHVVTHDAAYRGYRGIYALRAGETLVVTAPWEIAGELQRRIGARDADDVFSVDALSRLFGDAVDRVVGPAWLGYSGAAEFRPAPEIGARLLAPDDAQAVRALRDACDATEWEHSGIAPERTPIFGVEREGGLAAAASYEALAEDMLHVGVITHPAWRGRGLGRAVASAITAYGLERGAVMQWQTLLANAPSLAVGRSLGYRQRFESIAVRLRELRLAPG